MAPKPAPKHAADPIGKLAALIEQLGARSNLSAPTIGTWDATASAVTLDTGQVVPNPVLMGSVSDGDKVLALYFQEGHDIAIFPIGGGSSGGVESFSVFAGAASVFAGGSTSWEFDASPGWDLVHNETGCVTVGSTSIELERTGVWQFTFLMELSTNSDGTVGQTNAFFQRAHGFSSDTLYIGHMNTPAGVVGDDVVFNATYQMVCTAGDILTAELGHTGGSSHSSSFANGQVSGVFLG